MEKYFVTEQEQILDGFRLGCQIFDHPEVWLDAVHRSIDIQDHKLVNLLLVEDLDGIDRITDVSMVLEFDGFHQTLPLKEQTWNDTRSEHFNSGLNSHIGIRRKPDRVTRCLFS